MKRVLILLAAAILSAGCSTTPPGDAQFKAQFRADEKARAAVLAETEARVRVTSNPDVVRGCVFRGNVGDDAAHLVTCAIGSVRACAVAMGGDTVFVGPLGQTKEVYKCGE